MVTEAPALPLSVVLAVNVRHERDARGWTQEQLGVYSELTRATVAIIEAGRVASRAQSTTTKTVEAIANALGVSWSDLLAVWPTRAEDYASATRVYREAKRATLRGLEVVEGEGAIPLPRLAAVGLT